MSDFCKSLQLFVFCCLIYCESRTLPSYIKKCKLDYPQVNECISQRLNDIKPKLIDGIPELKIPSFKPLKLPNIEVETGTAFKLIVSDITVDEVIDFQLTHIEFDVINNNKIRIKIYIPRANAHGIFNLKGKLAMLDMNNEGTGHLNISKIDLDTNITTKIETKEGQRYINWVKDKYRITHSTPIVYFENIVPGNENLNRQMNQVINENMGELEKEFKPLINHFLYKFAYSIVRQIFLDYSLEELFLL